MLLECKPACRGANRKCKDGDCVCEIGYQAIDDDGDCEKGRKITNIEKTTRYTANVYRELQGLCGEIKVEGFQIYGDCMNTCNPYNFKISTL